MNNIRPIETETDYNWALREISRYFDREPGLETADGKRFRVLLGLVGNYESKHWPIEAPDPVEAIKSVIAAKVRTQTDLAKVLGSRSRASEVLSRKRPLTIEMVRKLHAEWKLPADLLIRAYEIDYEIAPLKKRPQIARDARAGAFTINRKSDDSGKRQKVRRKRQAAEQ
jgi:HTH-type transcriptional regulator / antitoxin HigA